MIVAVLMAVGAQASEPHFCGDYLKEFPFYGDIWTVNDRGEIKLNEKRAEKLPGYYEDESKIRLEVRSNEFIFLTPWVLVINKRDGRIDSIERYRASGASEIMVHRFGYDRNTCYPSEARYKGKKVKAVNSPIYSLEACKELDRVERKVGGNAFELQGEDGERKLAEILHRHRIATDGSNALVIRRRVSEILAQCRSLNGVSAALSDQNFLSKVKLAGPHEGAGPTAK